jgi:hypothetical protein
MTKKSQKKIRKEFYKSFNVVVAASSICGDTVTTQNRNAMGFRVAPRGLYYTTPQ